MSDHFQSVDETLLFDQDGQRKYLCLKEGKRFLKAADGMDTATRVFCRLLLFTGPRLSEALELTPRRLDADALLVVFRTLKRRKRVFRAAPIPAGLMQELLTLAQGKTGNERLWTWCRQTAWRRVKKVMAMAEIHGPKAVPRGLRHQFGIQALEQNVPLVFAQRLLGHTSPNTTIIYQHATGKEARRFVTKLWRAYGAE